MAPPRLAPFDELFAIARIFLCAASMPRVSEPYFVSISTSRGSTVCALNCVASPP
jgi:hypothetical protein